TPELEIERPWRTITWELLKRTELMDDIKTFKPTVGSVSQARVLLVGPVGAGKSSFFNSINSVFRGHVTSQAMSGCSSTSLTTQFRTYSVKAGREGKPLPIILCDTMGLEDSKGAGLDIDDISSILKGHLPDCYQFNPSAPLHSKGRQRFAQAVYSRGGEQLTQTGDLVELWKEHFKELLNPVNTSSAKGAEPEDSEVSVSISMVEVAKHFVNVLSALVSPGVPQLVLLTKVDEACPLVKKDVRNVYKSGYIKELMQKVSTRLGVPLSCVVPVRNYSEELELDLNCDILLLSAIIQMLRFADNYFDDVSDRLSEVKLKE
ncbi:interferon-induced protein 44-like, partial [Stegastes partitus]|uniref:Interferon-induced protein 44-like n=1 Tax=Stegastes partitus TaxID=144197 RepID=A0A9Y4NVK9_9TELE